MQWVQNPFERILLHNGPVIGFSADDVVVERALEYGMPGPVSNAPFKNANNLGNICRGRCLHRPVRFGLDAHQKMNMVWHNYIMQQTIHLQ